MIKYYRRRDFPEIVKKTGPGALNLWFIQLHKPNPKWEIADIIPGTDYEEISEEEAAMILMETQ